MHKKHVAVLLIVLLIIIFGYFMSFKNTVTNGKYYENKPSKTEIRISLNCSSQDRKGQVYQEIINNYNKEHDDVIIQNHYVPGNDYFSRVKVDFASGNEADIFITWPGITVNRFSNKEKIVDLRRELDKDFKWHNGFDKSVWKYVSEDDKILGLPLVKTYAAMFVNTDVLQSVGIEIPKTYEQLKKSIPTLRASGITPIAFDISDEGLLLYRYIAGLLGGKFNASNIQDNGVPNEYYVQAAEYIKELYNLGAFSEDLFTMTKNESDHLFMTKKAAFIVRYSDFLETVDKNVLLDSVSIEPFPGFETGLSTDRAILYGVGTDTIFVSSKNWNNEEMRDKILSVVKYFTSEEVAYYIAENMGSVPAVKIKTAPTKAKNMVYQKNYDFISKANQIIDFSNYYIDADVLLHIAERFPSFLENKNTIYDVWEYAYNYVMDK